MHYTEKRRLRTRPLLTLLGAFILLGAPLLAAAEPASRVIRVNGEAERRVAPDMATLRVQVLSEDRDPATARASADAVVRAALRVLRAAGVAEEDVDSTGLSIEPQYRWIKESREQELVAYRVTRSAVIRVLNLDDLGSLLQSLSEAGVNRMQPPQLGLRDEERIYREVLVEAARNARDRATALAAALGESLGGVLSLATEDAHSPGPQPRPMARATLTAEGTSEPGESYSAGDLTYRVRVNAEFAVQALDKTGE